MSKIIINGLVSSKSNKETINNEKAIYKDNNITYKLNGVLVNIKLLDNRVLITRENDEMKLSLEFEEYKNISSKYLVKDLNLNIKVETKTKKLVMEDSKLEIEYDLYMNDEFSDSFTFNLEWRDN